MKEAIENINYKDFNIVLKKEANFNSAYSTSIYCDGKLLTEFKTPIPYEESLEAAKAYCDNYLNQKGIKVFESFKDYISKNEKINESIADKQWVKKELGDFNKKQNPDKSDFQYLTDSILKHLGIKVKDSSDITEHLFNIWSDTERFEKNEFNDIISSLLSFVK